MVIQHPWQRDNFIIFSIIYALVGVVRFHACRIFLPMHIKYYFPLKLYANFTCAPRHSTSPQINLMLWQLFRIYRQINCEPTSKQKHVRRKAKREHSLRKLKNLRWNVSIGAFCKKMCWWTWTHTSQFLSWIQFVIKNEETDQTNRNQFDLNLLKVVTYGNWFYCNRILIRIAWFVH